MGLKVATWGVDVRAASAEFSTCVCENTIANTFSEPSVFDAIVCHVVSNHYNQINR